MSWEEDFLMVKIRELEARLIKLEAVCPGMDSSTSIDSPETKDEKTASESQKPVPTTESLSEPDQTENSSASSTAGNGPETPAHSASKKEWVKFVRSQGFESEGANAEDYTRNQLREWWESDEE